MWKTTKLHLHLIGGFCVYIVLYFLTIVFYPSMKSDLLYWLVWFLVFAFATIFIECKQHDTGEQIFTFLFDSVLDVLCALAGFFAGFLASLLINPELLAAVKAIL